MSAPTFKDLAAGVRRVWSPPAQRPWSSSDVAIMKLLKAADEHQCNGEALKKLRDRAVQIVALAGRFAEDGQADSVIRADLQRELFVLAGGKP